MQSTALIIFDTAVYGIDTAQKGQVFRQIDTQSISMIHHSELTIHIPKHYLDHLAILCLAMPWTPHRCLEAAKV